MERRSRRAFRRCSAAWSFRRFSADPGIASELCGDLFGWYSGASVAVLVLILLWSGGDLMGMIWAMIWVALSDASGVYICAFASVAFWGAAVGIRTKNFIHSTICRILSKSLKISQILLNTPFFSLIHKHFYMHTHTHTPYTHIRTHIQSIYLSIYLVCIISYHIISYHIISYPSSSSSWSLPLPDLAFYPSLCYTDIL